MASGAVRAPPEDVGQNGLTGPSAMIIVLSGKAKASTRLSTGAGESVSPKRNSRCLGPGGQSAGLYIDDRGVA